MCPPPLPLQQVILRTSFFVEEEVWSDGATSISDGRVKPKLPFVRQRCCSANNWKRDEFPLSNSIFSHVLHWQRVILCPQMLLSSHFASFRATAIVPLSSGTPYLPFDADKDWAAKVEQELTFSTVRCSIPHPHPETIQSHLPNYTYSLPCGIVDAIASPILE